MQGYGEVGKVRGKMDIFWTSLTRPWWKSSKPKISGGATPFSVVGSAEHLKDKTILHYQMTTKLGIAFCMAFGFVPTKKGFTVS